MAESLATLQALADALDPEVDGPLLQGPLAEAVGALRVRCFAALLYLNSRTVGCGEAPHVASGRGPRGEGRGPAGLVQHDLLCLLPWFPCSLSVSSRPCPSRLSGFITVPCLNTHTTTYVYNCWMHA